MLFVILLWMELKERYSVEIILLTAVDCKVMCICESYGSHYCIVLYSYRKHEL